MKLDLTLGDLAKIGKSQKYTLSVDVEGGRLVVLKKQKDSQEDWNTFTHDKSEWGPLRAPWPLPLLSASPSRAQPLLTWGGDLHMRSALVPRGGALGDVALQRRVGAWRGICKVGCLERGNCPVGV